MDDETFDDAILQLVRERCNGDPGVLVEWVICAYTRNFNDDGDAVSWIGYIPGPDSVPHHRLLGLLDAGQTIIRTEMIEERT